MGRIGYVVKRAFQMDHTALRRTLKALHDKTGRSRLWLLWDMQRCALRYGAGYMDYALYEMYRLSRAQRDTYITRGRNNELIRRYNDLSYAHVFDDKAIFDARFEAYIHRDWIRADADKNAVLAFLDRHKTVIAKPCEGMCGKGVEKWHVGDDEDVYGRIRRAAVPMVLEEVIRQHPTLEKLYPLAINTARVVTIVNTGTVHIICAYLRIGNGGAHVDNFNSGGMVAPVEETTGIVRAAAVDKHKRVYDRHPMTGEPIKGLCLPDWEAVRALVTAAAVEVPQMAYIGWDVAFTPNGPCLVEGNNFPGHDIYQLPAHTPDGIGMWAKFQV